MYSLKVNGSSLVSRAPLIFPLFPVLVVCSLAFSAAILTFRAIGQGQPPAEVLKHLHLTECRLPCWSGIVPGETRYNDARRLTFVVGSSPFVSDPETVSAFFNDLPQAFVYIYTQGGVVSEITIITTYVDDLRLGDVLAYFGDPSCPLPTSDRSSITYLSSNAKALIWANLDSNRYLHRTINTINIRLTTPDCLPE